MHKMTGLEEMNHELEYLRGLRSLFSIIKTKKNDVFCCKIELDYIYHLK